jgi:uncharacterized protein
MGGDIENKEVQRPAPDINQDTAFFWEGAKEGKILIQKCSSCGRLRHPPRPACPYCHSFEWETQESSGRGTLYSYTVHHHPPLPGFDLPVVVALVELEEGTRLVANLLDVEPDRIEIGSAVTATFIDGPNDLRLPAFRVD